MEIRENNNIIIIAPICSNIDKNKTLSIINKIKNEKRQIAIDLNYVQECSIEFIEYLKNFLNKKIGIFNIPSDIFVLFNIMKIDKVANLFVSEMDFEENSHQIINREFSII